MSVHSILINPYDSSSDTASSSSPTSSNRIRFAPLPDPRDLDDDDDNDDEHLPPPIDDDDEKLSITTPSPASDSIPYDIHVPQIKKTWPRLALFRTSSITSTLSSASSTPSYSPTRDLVRTDSLRGWWGVRRKRSTSDSGRGRTSTSFGTLTQPSSIRARSPPPLTPKSTTRPSTAPSTQSTFPPSPVSQKSPVSPVSRPSSLKPKPPLKPMLNGRIYGLRRHRRNTSASLSHNANPFANVPAEPEFVEWGYGGMGAVNSGKEGYKGVSGGDVLGALGGGDATAKGVKAAEDEGPGFGVVGSGSGDVEDDGSGMGWVRKRREQREREKREREEAEAKVKQLEAVEEAPSEPTAEPEPELELEPESVPFPVPEPVDTLAHPDPKPEHYTTAVTLLPSHPRSRSRSHHRSHSRAASGIPDIDDIIQPVFVVAAAVDSEEISEKMETRGRSGSTSTSNSVSTISTSTTDDDDDTEDDDDEESTAEINPKTALGAAAGVEKVSRHATVRGE